MSICTKNQIIPAVNIAWESNLKKKLFSPCENFKLQFYNETVGFEKNSEFGKISSSYIIRSVV